MSSVCRLVEFYTFLYFIAIYLNSFLFDNFETSRSFFASSIYRLKWFYSTLYNWKEKLSKIQLFNFFVNFECVSHIVIIWASLKNNIVQGMKQLIQKFYHVYLLSKDINVKNLKYGCTNITCMQNKTLFSF